MIINICVVLLLVSIIAVGVLFREMSKYYLKSVVGISKIKLYDVV